MMVAGASGFGDSFAAVVAADDAAAACNLIVGVVAAVGKVAYSWGFVDACPGEPDQDVAGSNKHCLIVASLQDYGETFFADYYFRNWGYYLLCDSVVALYSKDGSVYCYYY